MATSRARPVGRRLLRFAESRKNLAGCAGGLAGLALTFTGAAGSYWPLVVAGLYGAGALIAPPERVAAPHFPDAAEQLDVLREDFVRLRQYLASIQLPPAASGRLTELDGLLDALVAHGEWHTDPDSFHTLARAVREDVPEAVETFVRARWWTRFTPGNEPPERQLEHQLTLIHEELTTLAAALQDAETQRQESLTHYLKDRRRN
ncbi:hypothetical protein ACH4SP_22395 [Streptomyces sp. NPDC021093]|uniref:hypothetical protein n=1 Tax=Streptomyces sp. NPDC021093 TaxID=3365112 RepID=UPI00378C447D